MANLTAADLETRFLDRLQINVTTDPPIATVASAGSVAASKTYVFLNEAFATVWEIWGGSVTAATSATLWTPDVTADTTGKLTGDLQTIKEIVNVWTTTTSGSTGGGSGDLILELTDLQEIEWLRSHSTGLGTYTESQKYAVTMVSSSNAAASSNKWLLDVWPGISGRYYPAHYIPQFTALAAATDVPDLPDLAQHDIYLLAALNAADLIGRGEFKASIQADLSEKTRLTLERKSESLVSGDRNK